MNAATKCMPLPDPDLIKSCCHHLLFLIPLQYLYSWPPSDKGGGGEEVLLLRRRELVPSRGERASVAGSPAASATISHFPRVLWGTVSPKGGPAALTVNPSLSAPPVPTAPASLPCCRPLLAGCL